MDVEFKSPQQEVKIEPEPETNGVKEKERPTTPKNTPKTRSRPSDNDKERNSQSNRNSSNTSQKNTSKHHMKSDTKVISVNLTKLEDNKVIEPESQNGEHNGVNGKNESTDNATSKDKEETTEKSNEDSTTTTETAIVIVETSTTTVKITQEAIEMDPLVLATDEVDPELQFDETSDVDSGKNSPIISRCKTRRSHTRNIPTPKTPKPESTSHTPEVNDQEVEKESLNESMSEALDSADNLSTLAEVGSDVSRLEFIDRESSVTTEDSTYLNASRERSLADTLRNLSARRSIRPISEVYRKQAIIRNIQDKSELNYSYPNMTESVVDCAIGGKRKNRSLSPQEESIKKRKSDSPSFFSSPIQSIKNRFRGSDVSSSTPKLTSYKDSNKDIREAGTEGEDNIEVGQEAVEDHRSWCTIM